MKRTFWAVLLPALSVGALVLLQGEQIDIGTISKTPGQRPKMAIPDFRGAGDAQPLMAAFNQTLRSDVDGAGLFDMVPRAMFPLNVPQQPSDFTTPPPP